MHLYDTRAVPSTWLGQRNHLGPWEEPNSTCQSQDSLLVGLMLGQHWDQRVSPCLLSAGPPGVFTWNPLVVMDVTKGEISWQFKAIWSLPPSLTSMDSNSWQPKAIWSLPPFSHSHGAWEALSSGEYQMGYVSPYFPATFSLAV